jgi:tripartite-type tricarboxylate transporter receptor subunit TctC
VLPRPRLADGNCGSAATASKDSALHLLYPNVIFAAGVRSISAAAEMLKNMTGTNAVHVPYRGAAPALNDLLGGQLDFLFDPGIAIEHVKAGTLRALAIGSPQRSPQLPDVPTLDELGLTGFDADALFGIYAPAGTSPEIVARLNREINRSLANAALNERIATLGNIAAPMSPEEFKEKSRKDSERFGAIIRERGISAN